MDGELAHDFSAMFYGLASRELPDPDLLLSGYLKGSPSNYGVYYNPEYDTLYEKQSQATDPAERKRLVLQMEKMLMNDLPTIPVFWRVYDSISWPYVKGYVNTGLYTDKDMQRVWLAK